LRGRKELSTWKEQKNRGPDFENKEDPAQQAGWSLSFSKRGRSPRHHKKAKRKGKDGPQKAGHEKKYRSLHGEKHPSSREHDRLKGRQRAKKSRCSPEAAKKKGGEKC